MKLYQQTVCVPASLDFPAKKNYALLWFIKFDNEFYYDYQQQGAEIVLRCVASLTYVNKKQFWKKLRKKVILFFPYSDEQCRNIFRLRWPYGENIFHILIPIMHSSRH